MISYKQPNFGTVKPSLPVTEFLYDLCEILRLLYYLRLISEFSQFSTLCSQCLFHIFFDIKTYLLYFNADVDLLAHGEVFTMLNSKSSVPVPEIDFNLSEWKKSLKKRVVFQITASKVMVKNFQLRCYGMVQTVRMNLIKFLFSRNRAVLVQSTDDGALC